MKYIRYLLFLVFLFPSGRSAAQYSPLSTPVRLHGGLNLSGVFTSGLPGNISPFNYFISGNLNINLYNALNIPVHVNYSDRKISLSQGYNFNQIGLHPSYKWATAHVGTVAMAFSPYTLNGHQFTGGGLELSPRKWKIQMMGGRLLKGQYEDSLVTGPTFKRMGMGYRVEYRPSNFIIGTTLFKAYDVAGSVPEAHLKFHDQIITPRENFIMGFHLGATLASNLQFTAEYANSIMTRDSAASSQRHNSLAGIFYKGNRASESSHALKAGLHYHIERSNTLIGLGYERIDPDYSTLGGYYFNNDLVNYTLNFSQRFAQGDYTFGGSVGFQKDDLENQRVNRQRRLVGNLNAQGKLSEKMSLGLQFSNFRSYRFVNDTYTRLNQIPGEVVDTLNYSMISRTAALNLVQKLVQNAEKETSLSLQGTYLASRQGHEDQSTENTRIINTFLGYSIRFIPARSGMNVSVSYFRNALPVQVLSGVGPVVSFQKSFSDKLTLSANLSAFRMTGTVSSLTLNSRLNLGWQITSGHRIHLNSGWVRNERQYLNGNISYNYIF